MSRPPAPAEGPGRDSGRGYARIYLVRHGRTALNVAGALRGHIDVPLDAVGCHEASLLGAELAPCQLRAIVSSPLQRAVQTASPLAQLTGLVTRTDQRLTDRGYGEWAGVSATEVIARWGSVGAAPGVEPAAQVRDRALAALEDIAGTACGASAVVVSHQAVNRIVLVGLDPGLGPPDELPQETGCFNTIQCYAEPGGRLTWDVLSVNKLPPEVGGRGPERDPRSDAPG
ncbi:MAG: histidine phosphatase family protein [Acidimicrobiales bacterium]